MFRHVLKPGPGNLFFSVFESDDDEICEVLEDESEDDLHVFDDSEGSDWDSGSTRNPKAH